MKIDLLFPPHQNDDFLEYFTQSLGEALLRLGVECRLLKPEKNNPSAFVDDLLRHAPDCTLSFNGLLPDEKDNFLADLVKIPHVACLTDFPTSFNRLAKSKYTIITSPDRFGSIYLQGINARRVLYMPHAISKSTHAEMTAKKEYEIVLISSASDPEKIRKKWKKTYPKPLVDAMIESAERTLAEPKLPYQEALSDAINEKMFETPIDLNPIDFLWLLHEQEVYIESLNIVNALNELKDFTIDVFGRPHETSELPFLIKNKNVSFHPPITFQQSFDIQAKAKVVLDSSPLLKEGGGIGVFAALALNSLPLTNKTAFIAENFKEGENLLTYDSNSWEATRNSLQKVLQDPHLCERMVEKGREKVMREHTWDVRAASLVKELEPLLKGFHENMRD